MIIYKTGNLLDAEEQIIVHGCNAQGVMRSGVAKAIREKYPRAFEEYENTFILQKKKLLVGQVIWSFPDGEFEIFPGNGKHIIANGITQQFYGYEGARYVSYAAIEMVFDNVKKMVEKMEKEFGSAPTVAIPRIGAGLGGGNWDEIAAIIEKAMGEHTVVVYDLPEKEQ